MKGGPLHHARSSKWVECLGSAFDQRLKSDSVHVLCKSSSKARGQFGLNELLFDVCIFRAGKTQAARGKQLSYVAEPLWAIESELARDSGQAIKDFNKLVLASAPNKLFVGPADVSKAYLDALLAPANACSGSVWVALVPHPDGWYPSLERRHSSGSIALWKLVNQQWRAVIRSVTE